MRKAWIGVIVIALLAAAAGPAAAKVSPGLGGCRLIAASDDKSQLYGGTENADATARAVMASRALKMLKQVKDPEIHRIVTHPTRPTFSGFGARIQAWCDAHYTQRQIDGS